jgi:hypothetical protein
MRSTVALSLVAALFLAGCGAATEEPTEGSKAPATKESVQGVTTFEKLEARHVKGTFTFRGVTLKFETEVLEQARETTFELRGMILTFTADPTLGAFDVDGFTPADGQDTQMTLEDRLVIMAFDKSIGATVADKMELPAVDLLVRNATIWGDYSDTLPLKRTFHGRLDQNNVGANNDLCWAVNKPGNGTIVAPKYSRGTHDCGSGAGDCSDWWGCDGGEDNASTDYMFLSMHPAGPCGDTTWFGNSAGEQSCFEPDHSSGYEFSYGACEGRCGGDCGSGTVFSAACRDHDQCVRNGHASASGWCDDDLVNAAWDAAWMSNCGGTVFAVPYNWAGRGSNPACPTSWLNTNDGCDANCQFIDMDCFR